MTIQVNTDKNIEGKEGLANFVDERVNHELKRFDEYITRIEVHLSDENGEKKGANDQQCVIEARMRTKQPIAVTAQGDTLEKAVSGAISKMKAALSTAVGKLQKH